MKKQDTFVSRESRKLKTFKYKLVSKVKVWLANRVAPVTNHKDFPTIANLIWDITFTGLVCWFVIWTFGINDPLRKGFGIAVTLAIIQHYIKWFYSIRK